MTEFSKAERTLFPHDKTKCPQDNTIQTKDKEITSLKQKQQMAGQQSARLKSQFVKLATMAKDFKLAHTELKENVSVELRYGQF